MPGPVVLTRLADLAQHIAPTDKVLVLTTPSRRHVDDVRAALPDRGWVVFDQARVHVPRAVVDDAVAMLDRERPDVLLTIGGGAATGLGKAVALQSGDIPLMSVATTYAGSEMTSIWGQRDTVDGRPHKTTGRDEAVRPRVVVHDASLLEALPRRTATLSLLNALAHPISALSTDALDDDARRRGLQVVERVSFAVRQMIAHGAQHEVRQDALSAAALAGAFLNDHAMGAHHKLVHAFGGRHDLPHAQLHATLLPHSLLRIRAELPVLFDALAAAAGTADLPRFVVDTMARVGAPTSLQAMGLSLDDVLAVADDTPGRDATQTLFLWLGGVVAQTAKVETWGAENVPVVVDGDLESASQVLFAVHGRGSHAPRIAALAREAIGHDASVAVIAPQAASDAWVTLPYSAEEEELRPQLAKATERLAVVVDELLQRKKDARVVLFGFSQGACLALEVLAHDILPTDDVVAIAGARYAGHTSWPRSVRQTRVHLAIADDDKWVDADDVASTAESLRAAGAEVTFRRRRGGRHVVHFVDRLALRRALQLEPDAPRGYGSHHHSEVLEDAVPPRQNTPRHSPLGLVPEQISGTGFVAARHENLRTWTYRVRPSAQHTPFVVVDHATLTADFDAQPLVNLDAWSMPPLDNDDTDFVDGLVTLGGAGHPNLRRGYALHVYRASRDMHERSFASADGDLVVLPERGALVLQTELGVLDVAPGQVAVIPRGLRFAVHLDGDVDDGVARGYVGEVYARHFALPERGPIGANGLADERHFQAPTPHYEDRLDVGHRLATKMGGTLYEATQDHSPFDVVGWHGNYAPYVYDTSLFSPVSNTRVDHGDPSLFTVLSAGLDEQGAHGLDLVVFPARWDATEHTFRPPFFHRNVTTEINGIVRDPGLRPPFETGMVFITPSMTAHGVRARNVQRHLAQPDDVADKPARMSDHAMWFQFETSMHFCPTPWAQQAQHRRTDWPYVWGECATRFSPSSLSPSSSTSESS